MELVGTGAGGWRLESGVVVGARATLATTIGLVDAPAAGLGG